MAKNKQLSAAAQALVAARWAKTSPEERSATAQAISNKRYGHVEPPPRCPCGTMTLKRAKARGRTREHKPECSFYPKNERTA